MTKARDNSKYREPIKGINLMIIVYFVLTIYENILNTGSGSILKYFGYIIIVSVIIYKKSIKITKELFLMLIWIAVCAISLIWSQGFSDGIEYVLSAGNMAIIALLVSNLEWNQREIDFLFKAYITSAFVFALVLVVGGTGFHYTSLRMTVTILGKQYDPNVVVAFIAPAVMLTVMLLFKNKIGKLLAAFCVVFMMYASFLANSRGGMLSLLVAFFAFAIMLLIKSDRRNLIKYVVLFVVLGYTLLYLVTKYIDPYLVDRVFNLSLTESSSVERIGLIGRAWEMFLERPLLGYGCGGANAVTHQGTHNMFMLVLAETGVLGFIPFVSFFVVLLIRVWKSVDWQFCPVLIAMYGVVFFLDSYHGKYMWNIIIFALIIIGINESNKQKESIPYTNRIIDEQVNHQI